MARFFLIFIVLLVAVPASSDELSPGPEQTFPDLLSNESEDGPYGPDLLKGGPYIADPVRVMGDPIFEDDFSLNRAPLIVYDPLEPLNRVFFVFNDKLYFWVLKPVKNVYSAALPNDIRHCIANFLSNLGSPIRLINNLLQGEFEDAGIVLSRFVINSTLGVFGFGDAATVDFDINPSDADFGQTLGKWGVGEGIYICWPFLGPSNVRDSIGFIGDVYMHPVAYITTEPIQDLSYLAVDRINTLSISPDVYDELKRIAVDPYIAARQAFFEYRRKIINER